MQQGSHSSRTTHIVLVPARVIQAPRRPPGRDRARSAPADVRRAGASAGAPGYRVPPPCPPAGRPDRGRHPGRPSGGRPARSGPGGRGHPAGQPRGVRPGPGQLGWRRRAVRPGGARSRSRGRAGPAHALRVPGRPPGEHAVRRLRPPDRSGAGPLATAPRRPGPGAHPGTAALLRPDMCGAGASGRRPAPPALPGGRRGPAGGAWYADGAGDGGPLPPRCQLDAGAGRGHAARLAAAPGAGLGEPAPGCLRPAGGRLPAPLAGGERRPGPVGLVLQHRPLPAQPAAETSASPAGGRRAGRPRPSLRRRGGPGGRSHAPSRGRRREFDTPWNGAKSFGPKGAFRTGSEKRARARGSAGQAPSTPGQR